MSDITLPLFSLQPETKEISLTRGKVAIVDAADYEWLSQWKWYACRGKYTFYAQRYAGIIDGKECHVIMHRLILGITDTKVLIDHRDRNGLNNTRDNLRPATKKENGYNQGMHRNNTSGYKGVTLERKSGKWEAQIQANGKKMHLGLHASPEDAARTYDAIARELHGKFARLNFGAD